MPSKPRTSFKHALYVMVGASGAGKTTLLKRVIRSYFPNLAHFHFDDTGVPSTEKMTEDFGNSELWQAHTTRLWLEKIARSHHPLSVLDAQTKPSVLKETADEYGFSALHIVLIDCGHEERRRRLVRERSQPELNSLDTYAWAAYLRGQADALRLEIIDTTSATLEESTTALARSLERFADHLDLSLDVSRGGS